MRKLRRKAKKPSAKALPRPKAAVNEEFAELLAVLADVTNPLQRAFLAGFVVGKGIKAAHRLSGVHPKSHYGWLETDTHYCERFQLARTMLADMGEEEAYRRAFSGYDTPVIHRGKIKSWYKSYSDALAMFLLRGMKSHVYGPHAADFDSAPPSAIEITIKKEGEETEKAAALPEISIPINEPEE